MKRRLLAMAIVSLLGAALLAPVALGEELSARELKKLNKQAGKAFASGQVEKAVEAYRQILAGPGPGDSRRADAFYTVTMCYLSPSHRDEQRARSLMAELAESFPRHRRGLGLSAAWSWLLEIEEVRAAIRVAAARLAAQEAALAQERQERWQAAEVEQQEQEEQSAATGGKVRSLEAELRQARSELSETRAELARKEEALEKLKDALVGRAGGLQSVITCRPRLRTRAARLASDQAQSRNGRPPVF